MIFITAGTQEPFDRLIKTIDDLMPVWSPNQIVVQALPGLYQPRNFDIQSYIEQAEFDDILERAELIICHAGMGTIITALQKRRPILIMPRLMKYKEHRNEHQLATANKMKAFGYVHVAKNEIELKRIILSGRASTLKSLHTLSPFASVSLLNSIKSYVNNAY